MSNAKTSQNLIIGEDNEKGQDISLGSDLVSGYHNSYYSSQKGRSSRL